MGAEFSYKITEPLAVLSSSQDGDFTTEANYISFNGRAAKLDIRKWDRRTEEGKMLKGIALNEEEAAALLEALQNR